MHLEVLNSSNNNIKRPSNKWIQKREWILVRKLGHIKCNQLLKKEKKKTKQKKDKWCKYLLFNKNQIFFLINSGFKWILTLGEQPGKHPFSCSNNSIAPLLNAICFCNACNRCIIMNMKRKKMLCIHLWTQMYTIIK